MIKILLFMLLCSPAAAEPPWLEEKTYGTVPVEVKKGTITIGSIAAGSTVTAITEGTFSVISLSISVVGGTGSSLFSSTGTIRSCSIAPPTAASTYLFEIVTDDADEFPIFGTLRKVVGKVGLIGDRLILGSHKARFEDAAPDGTYKARCVLLK